MCVFKFVIGVHIDDLKMLEKIQGQLGLGTIISYQSMSYLIVYKLSEVKVIIDIFTSPLNTSKRLNFLAWKEAYILYTGSSIKSPALKTKIENIQKSMNINRRFDKMIYTCLHLHDRISK